MSLRVGGEANLAFMTFLLNVAFASNSEGRNILLQDGSGTPGIQGKVTYARPGTYDFGNWDF